MPKRYTARRPAALSSASRMNRTMWKKVWFRAPWFLRHSINKTKDTHTTHTWTHTDSDDDDLQQELRAVGSSSKAEATGKVVSGAFQFQSKGALLAKLQEIQMDLPFVETLVHTSGDATEDVVESVEDDLQRERPSTDRRRRVRRRRERYWTSWTSSTFGRTTTMQKW